ncbi:MAG: hypothetical protein E7358_05145 [Clostridiales bacterium]|nr:hypothetical protein [Clostridiales bacterium]
MQKTRSIFVKVLVLVCALCCSLAFVFGLTGCSDDGETVDVGVVTITKIEAAGNQIKITYSDGKIVFCDKEAAVDCEHNLKEYHVSRATCIAANEILKVCDKGCGYADIEYGAKDATNHVVDVNDPAEENVEQVLPTCTEAGKIKITCDCGEVLYVNDNVPANGHDFEVTQPTCELDGYKTCKVCGFVEEASVENGLLATGHDAVYTWILVEDKEANICVDGAHEVFACATCFANCPDCEEAIKDTREIPAEGHAWTNEWTVVAPTLTEAGSFKGFCDVCGTNATIVLPALNNVDYNVSEIRAAACYSKGEDQYVFVYYGNEIAKCTFTVETEASHVDALGQELYKGKVYGDIDTFTRAGGEAEVDSMPACNVKVDGAVYCDICNGLVLVQVIGEHGNMVEVEDAYVPATCMAAGSRTYKCDREDCQAEGGLVVVPEAQLSHNYVVTPDEANKKLVITCSGNPAGTVCTYNQVVDMVDYGYDTVAATCKTDGSKTFWYIEEVGGAKKYLDPQVIPAYGHYYDDPANKLIKDKEYTYDELVAIFGAANIGKVEGYACVTEVDSTNNCSVSAQAVAYCSECNGLVIFKALGNHDWELTETVAPDCLNDGYKTYVCKADATHTKTEKNGDALGHNLEINMEESVLTGANATIVFECSRCDYVEIINGEITLNEDVDSTCKDHGYHYIEYKYTDPVTGLEVNDSKMLVAEKPLSTEHFYNGTKMNKASYTYSELVAIFGADHIGKVEGYELVTEVDSAFNCQNSAQAVYYCTVCDGLKIITATGDHAWGAWTEVAATCTEDSYRYRECTVDGCAGYELDSTYVATPATGHDYEYVLPTVADLLEGSYEMTVTCADCDYEFAFTFAQFNDTDYVKTVVVTNSCANEGLTTYAIDVKDGDKVIENVVFSVTTPVIEHVDAVPPVEKTWEHDGYIYTGYLCGECNKMIVTSKTEIVAE